MTMTWLPGRVSRIIPTVLAVCLLAAAMFLSSCYFGVDKHGVDAGIGYSRPPSPGADYEWMETGPGTGYWKYTGPPRPGEVWVPGHRRPDGSWVPGHWRDV
ncbi:hypothetical protein DPQ33_16815 [Oceanidesulfovibrio indonesiensis]|uniref:Uncharacterized protein n=1 Tax=Oceanidesulfovibrio indonesiensis TaxID=54767 RepID=A0A7M3MB78_9BACT|nr:hypothetical protein [Oceanidesulfovibrio indonesiensis]TVM14670.1 hypothetical protein DPQ33_16815 [Oceanidesulfovibrio indonesiensis]